MTSSLQFNSLSEFNAAYAALDKHNQALAKITTKNQISSPAILANIYKIRMQVISLLALMKDTLPNPDREVFQANQTTYKIPSSAIPTLLSMENAKFETADAIAKKIFDLVKNYLPKYSVDSAMSSSSSSQHNGLDMLALASAGPLKRKSSELLGPKTNEHVRTVKPKSVSFELPGEPPRDPISNKVSKLPSSINELPQTLPNTPRAKQTSTSYSAGFKKMSPSTLLAQSYRKGTIIQAKGHKYIVLDSSKNKENVKNLESHKEESVNRKLWQPVIITGQNVFFYNNKLGCYSLGMVSKINDSDIEVEITKVEGFHSSKELFFSKITQKISLGNTMRCLQVIPATQDVEYLMLRHIKMSLTTREKLITYHPF